MSMVKAVSDGTFRAITVALVLACCAVAAADTVPKPRLLSTCDFVADVALTARGMAIEKVPLEVTGRTLPHIYGPAPDATPHVVATIPALLRGITWRAYSSHEDSRTFSQHMGEQCSEDGVSKLVGEGV
jgi:hypothetical protein